MSLWRREALARFSELSREIRLTQNTTELWFCLWYDLFEPAYQKEPPDSKTIAHVYDYAYWSLKHRSQDIATSAIVSFFEHLPNDAHIRRDMPRWISQESFDMLWFAWEYTTKQDFADLRQEFIANKVRIDHENRTQRPHSVFH